METQKIIWVINCLGVSNGDILWIAIATLYQGLSVLLLLMEIATAVAAKSLQSCLTLGDPIDGSPPGSSVHGIFQARVLEWGAIAFFGK